MLESHWFNGVEKVLITSGASAPEHLVKEITDVLVQHFGGELVDKSIVNEGMYFSKPRSFTDFVNAKRLTIEGKER